MQGKKIIAVTNAGFKGPKNPRDCERVGMQGSLLG